MKCIEQKLGTMLFESLVEHIENRTLTPKERVQKYRSLLDILFKDLAIDAKQYISGLTSRAIYVLREYHVPQKIAQQTHQLRTLVNQATYSPAFEVGEEDDWRAAYLLAELLQAFAQLPIPARVLEYVKLLSWEELAKEEAVPLVDTVDFFVVVEEVTRVEKNKYCELLCISEEMGVIRLRLLNDQNENGFGIDFSEVASWLLPYQNLFVSQAVLEADNLYLTTKRSYVVLEPDYLIDATDLASCRQWSNANKWGYEDNHLIYMLNRFKKSEVSDRMLIGTVVGKMLDDMVTEASDYQFKDSFESVMRQQSFAMLCLANQGGVYNRKFLLAIYTEAQQHADTLKEVVQDYKDKQVILEPTFISNKYGLQGRLDLLIAYGDNKKRKDIVELKSSVRYPATHVGLYHNHEAQTLCYDLLVTSTYPDRTSSTFILYSSAPMADKPLRNVAEEKITYKQDLLMLRNRIVASELQMSRGDMFVLRDILNDKVISYPKYMQGQFTSFLHTLKNLEPVLKLYFVGFAQFIYRELQVAKIGSNDNYNQSNGHADLWKASKAEKIDNFEVLVYLKVAEVTDDFHIKLHFDNNLFAGISTVSSFRVGDIAVLYPTPNPEELNPLKSQILKCRALSVSELTVEVSLVNKQLDKNYFNSSVYWALDRDFRESGYKQLLQLLYEFVSADKRITDLVLGYQRPQFEPWMEVAENGLDTVQHEQVCNALRAKDYYLIQGPPGTGKTSKVLVEIVRNLSLLPKATMVVAFTNRAVDEICEKLQRINIKCIRLGRGDKPYYWSELSNNLKLDELNTAVQQQKVFVSTIATFASSLDLLKFKEFDTLIIDEASQVVEPQIAGLLKHFKKWIFIGDENQLPAVVVQSERDSVCSEERLQALAMFNYRESLFYRLKKNAITKAWDDCYGTLKYQYRMHADVAEFPKTYFYQNALEENTKKQRLPLPDYRFSKNEAVRKVLSKGRVLFIPSEADKRAKVNDEEAAIAAWLVRQIALQEGDDFNPYTSVGIITPFRAQIANIRNRLGDKFRAVTVDTVERFQGSERRIIIVSFAVKNPTQLGAIQSINYEGIDRKLNVALTRAQDQLILLGSAEILASNDIFANLIDFIKERNGYLENVLGR